MNEPEVDAPRWDDNGDPINLSAAASEMNCPHCGKPINPAA